MGTYTRPIDEGLKQLFNIMYEMADLSERTVKASIYSYIQGGDIEAQVRAWSDALRSMHDNLEEKAVELITRFQPVATDLRIIKSSMKIAYDFSRFGRYAYDISEVLKILDTVKPSKKERAIIDMGEKTIEALQTSIEILKTKNIEIAERLGKMENEIDEMYKNYLRTAAKKRQKSLDEFISDILFTRHLERIADHACYVAEEVIYMVKGNTIYFR